MNLAMLGADLYQGPSLAQTVSSGLSSTSSSATSSSPTALDYIKTFSDTALQALGLFRTGSTATVPTTTQPTFMNQYGSVVLVGGAALALVVVIAATRKRRRK
jgi:hypothetical protein